MIESSFKFCQSGESLLSQATCTAASAHSGPICCLQSHSAKTNGKFHSVLSKTRLSISYCELMCVLNSCELGLTLSKQVFTVLYVLQVVIKDKRGENVTEFFDYILM